MDKNELSVKIQILRELYKNSRVTYKKLSKICKISSVSCYNKTKEMEKEGIIRRYTLEIDPKKLGYNIETLIGLKIRKDKRKEIANNLYKLKNIEKIWEIIGEEDLIVHAFFKDNDQLDMFISNIEREFPEIEGIVIYLVLHEYENPNPWF